MRLEGPPVTGRLGLDHVSWTGQEEKEASTLPDFWLAYMHRDSHRTRVWRVLIVGILYFVFCYFVISFSGPPVIHARGWLTRSISFAVIVIAVALFIFLSFYVLDVTRCCRNFIDTASKRFMERHIASTGIHARKQVEEEWVLIRLIAMRTEEVGKLIFYPFIVWLFLFVSRSHYFDNWPTPVGLAVVICLGAMLAWICAFLLRRSAERARTRVVSLLEGRLYNIRGIDSPGGEKKSNEATVSYIELTIRK